MRAGSRTAPRPAGQPLSPSSADAVGARGSAGGSGWIMEVDAVTGNRPDTPSFDTNADSLVDATDLLTYQTGTAYPSGVSVGGIPTAPTFLRAKDRTLDDKLVNLSTGVLTKFREAGNRQSSGRAGWEQIR